MIADQPPATAGGSDLLCLFVTVKFHFKDFGKSFDDSIFDRTQLNFAAEQFFHRSHRFAFTGNDQIEVAEISIHVERKTVSGYPPRDVYTDGRNLSPRSVHAGQSFNPKGFNIKILHGANQNFLQIANKAMYVFTIGTQVDNWITYNLAQPVIGNFAATICFKQRHAAFVQDFMGCDYSITSRAPAERQRVRMLEQKQRVRLFARQNRALGSLLNVEPGAVFDAAESFDFQSSLSHYCQSRIRLYQHARQVTIRRTQ